MPCNKHHQPRNAAGTGPSLLGRAGCHGDIAGLPAAMQDWRVAVAACFGISLGNCPPIVVALAPNAAAYAQLCQLLGLRHEQELRWQQWRQSSDPNSDPELAAL